MADNDILRDDLPAEPPELPPREDSLLDQVATGIVNHMGFIKIGIAAAALGLTWLERRRFRKTLEDVQADVRKLGRKAVRGK